MKIMTPFIASIKLMVGIVLLLACLGVCVGGMMYDVLKGKSTLIK